MFGETCPKVEFGSEGEACGKGLVFIFIFCVTTNKITVTRNQVPYLNCKILLHVPSLCCTKSGSNVLEKCLQNAAHEESKAIVEKVVENEETLKSIISDKYGNYVVQKMLKTLPYEQRIEFSQILMDYFEKLEEIPERNSFENFVYRAVVNARQKLQNTNARSKLSGF